MTVDEPKPYSDQSDPASDHEDAPNADQHLTPEDNTSSEEGNDTTPFLPTNEPARTTTEHSTSRQSRTQRSLSYAYLALIIPLIAFTAVRILHQPVSSKCGRTKIFPFRVGCPYDCSPLRPNLANQSFYRLSSAWHFGALDPFRADHSAIPATAFHGAATLARSFLETEAEIRSNLQTTVARAGLEPILVNKQEHMHVSLSYLCCLTKDEANVATAVMDKWAASNTVSKHVTFTNMECLHERPDSVTVIWEVDSQSQIALMKLNQDVKEAVERAGVRVWIDRKDQMPFHTTIVGFQHEGRSKDISPYLARIGQVVQNANHLQSSAHINFDLSIDPVVGNSS